MVTRRTILKSGLSLSAMALPFRFTFEGEGPGPVWGGRVNRLWDETVSFNALYGNPPALGRSESRYVRVYAQPDDTEQIGSLAYIDVVPIWEVITAAPPRRSPHNPVWFKIGDEQYVHSSMVVPCQEVFHEPVDPAGGWFWGEVTVPVSWQHWKPSLYTARYYDFVYQQVFKVVELRRDAESVPWYGIENDNGARWWAQARHLRRIDPAEVSPISPGGPFEQKLIEIDLTVQVLTCHEFGAPVLTTRIASGAGYFGDDRDFLTPAGDYSVKGKTPSRHMKGGTGVDAYDLPGVPWCVYVNTRGVAVHGAYWHNDYGAERSHGCVNVTPDTAKWIYRWATPVLDYWNPAHRLSPEQAALGTPITIHY